jgi:signal recognition particle GTPase
MSYGERELFEKLLHRIEDNTDEMKKLNKNLEAFREDSQTIMSAVQGMGGMAALLKHLPSLMSRKK